jgi:multidrug transporter EmrE-like cation transporter
VRIISAILGIGFLAGCLIGWFFFDNSNVKDYAIGFLTSLVFSVITLGKKR